MIKLILWAVGLIIVVPTAMVAYTAFAFYIYYPWQHPRNIERMDAKNDVVWEEATARIVTVETELGTAEGTEKLSTEVVCYEGYFATKWSIKSGAPKTGFGPRSIGFETLQAKFPTGATLLIDFRRLCDDAIQLEIDKVPLKVRYSTMNIAAPELSLYCSFSFNRNYNVTRIYRADEWVSYPYIVALEDRPLRSLATRSEMGSSEKPSIYFGFARQWGSDMSRSDWKEDKECWDDNVGRCNEEMTNYCGKMP